MSGNPSSSPETEYNHHYYMTFTAKTPLGQVTECRRISFHDPIEYFSDVMSAKQHLETQIPDKQYREVTILNWVEIKGEVRPGLVPIQDPNVVPKP
jgi:alpha-ketoglutarate-dependent taurine dioxygenase